MQKQKKFWDKYRKGKNLSAKEFYRKRLQLIEMVIISLVVAVILSFVNWLFFNFPDTKETQYTKTMFILIILMVTVCVYRFNLYKRKYNG